MSRKGIRVDLAKGEAVQGWTTPISATNICSFIGITGYYRQLI